MPTCVPWGRPRGRSWVSLPPAYDEQQDPHVYAAKITYNVYITQLVQPEVVRNCSCSHEIPYFKVSVDLASSKVELVENPSLNEALIAGKLGSW